MKKMSLCIDARMINSSGIGIYIQNLLPHLSQDYALILLGKEQELTVFKTQFHFDFIAFDAPIYSIKEQLYFPFIIPRCDIFWSPHYNVPLLPIKAKKRVVTIHDVFHLVFQEELSFLKRLYASFVIATATKKSEQIFTVSHFSKSEIIKYTKGKPEKIKVIYNGLDKEKFKPYKNIAKDILEKKYQLPEKFILFVGNVKPHKNLKNLIYAFEILLKNDNFDYQLVIVGKKTGFITGDKELMSYIETQDLLRHKVHFTGFVEEEDLPLIYNLAALFVFPSLYEGFGLPPLEAMACGVMTAVSGIPVHKEIYEESVGTYFDPLDAQDMAEKILRVLNFSETEKQAHRIVGIEYVKKFTWEKSYQTFAENIKR